MLTYRSLQNEFTRLRSNDMLEILGHHLSNHDINARVYNFLFVLCVFLVSGVGHIGPK